MARDKFQKLRIIIQNLTLFSNFIVVQYIIYFICTKLYKILDFCSIVYNPTLCPSLLDIYWFPSTLSTLDLISGFLYQSSIRVIGI